MRKQGLVQAGAAPEALRVENLSQAEWWFEHYVQWYEFWADFLEERNWQDRRWEYTHLRLRKARGLLSRLVRQGTLFTYLDPELTREGPLAATNNRIEGGMNARLRDLLRNHRGLSLMQRVKAVYWWCHLHTEDPLPTKEMLSSMPTLFLLSSPATEQ